MDKDDYVREGLVSHIRIKIRCFGMITNNGYFDNPTFRGENFTNAHFFNYSDGSTNKKEKTPDGSKDENVFEIRTLSGIGIFLFKMMKILRSRHCELIELVIASMTSYTRLSQVQINYRFLLIPPVDEELSSE